MDSKEFLKKIEDYRRKVQELDEKREILDKEFSEYFPFKIGDFVKVRGVDGCIVGIKPISLSFSLAKIVINPLKKDGSPSKNRQTFYITDLSDVEVLINNFDSK